MKTRGIFLLALLTGCAGWERVDVGLDTTLAPRQQVQIWQGSHARVLHGVRLRADSLTGVPFQLPLSCDTCRIALARSQVDSLRLGNQEMAGFAIAAIPLLAIAFLAAALSGMGD